MRSFLRTLFVVLQLLAGPACAFAATNKPPPGFYPLLPRPAGPDIAADWQPPPGAKAATVAAKVDDRYLLTTTAGMPAEVRAFLADPTVFIYDGQRWHRGRYVDYHASFGIALVRTEEPLPGPVVEVFDGSGKDLTAEVGLDEDMPSVLRRRAASSRRLRASDGGAFFIDDKGRIAYVLGNLNEHSAERGPGAAIMEFMRTYFQTGGREVRPQPSFVKNEKPPSADGGLAPQP
ncbi:hypothetical protein HY633_04805 [Candidatus Uhrbacteria bacterium]|nr:hypothetical protein [Candidatus Uhrbacteria bacterium]